MPIKRKDRGEVTNENGTKPQYHMTTDHEMFLQAFESEYSIVWLVFFFSLFVRLMDTDFLMSLNFSTPEPTQIYRYLRSRTKLSVCLRTEALDCAVQSTIIERDRANNKCRVFFLLLCLF